MENLSIYVIILNWNGKKDTLECLASLEKVRYPHFKTILVDNGSTDGSVAIIQNKFPDVNLITNDQNLGFAEGNNIGINYALAHGADYLFLLNNDTIVDPDILDRFVCGMQKQTNAGILGAKIYLYEEPNKLDHLGGRWNKKKGSFDLIGLREIDDANQWETMQEMDYVCGCAFFVKRSVFEKIGLLEPKFFLIWEESDFCFRARRAGFLVLSCPDAKLWHKVSASFVGGKPHSTYFWWRNRLLWIERNCSKAEQFSLYWRILLPDIFHILKLNILKTIQLFFLRLFQPKKSHKKRHERVLKYKAALQGFNDYLFRRFGNAPAWIYRTKAQD